MNNLQTFFESPMAATFGQTMLHSLWQGVLIVSAYLIINRFLKKAENKVWLGLSAFAMQFFTSAFTFWSLRPSSFSSVATSSSEYQLALSLTQFVSQSQTESIIQMIQSNAHWLFAGWIIGFSFLMLRQIGGMAYIQFLKNTGLSKLPEKAEQAFDAVLKKIDVKIPSFDAYQSNKVDTAMVLGYLKPVILIPATLVSGLSSNQLELIIAHEIAHIRRNDFLINLMQTLLENLFFYHPVYWLVSHQIRDNREHACDDWAAEVTGNRILLAKTLAQIQLAIHQPKLAMAFGKKRMPMLNRIQRLLGVSPEGQKVKITALLLMLSAICTFGFVQSSQEDLAEKEKAKSELIETTEQNEIEISEIQEVTPITKVSNKVDSNIVRNEHILYDMGDENIRIKTDAYDVKINPNGFTINGRPQELSAAEKADLRNHFKEISKAGENVNAISKEINVEVKKIEAIRSNVMVDVDVNPQNDPKFKKSMEEIQEQGKIIAKYAQEFQTDVAKLDPKSANYEKDMDKLEKAFEAKIKVHEEKMSHFEVDMSDFEAKMKDIEVKIERDLEIPMQKIEKVMKSKEEFIEIAAEKVEFHHDAILKMLPKEVQDNLGASAHMGSVTPPRPPMPVVPNRNEKPAKPMKPEKPAKPEKVKEKNKENLKVIPPTPPKN
jgi:bla regulator protein BlaR1